MTTGIEAGQARADDARQAVEGALATPPPPEPEGTRQWSLDDVDRSTPAECAAAMKAGLLRDLGCSPHRPRR
jgi:hypothetical protein